MTIYGPPTTPGTLLGAGNRRVNKRSGSFLSWNLPEQSINEKIPDRCKDFEENEREQWGSENGEKTD